MKVSYNHDERQPSDLDEAFLILSKAVVLWRRYALILMGFLAGVLAHPWVPGFLIWVSQRGCGIFGETFKNVNLPL